MRSHLLAVGTLAAAFLVGCNDTPLHPTTVLGADNPEAYKPMPAPKPIPPAGYIPGEVQPQPAPPLPPSQPGAGPAPQ